MPCPPTTVGSGLIPEQLHGEVVVEVAQRSVKVIPAADSVDRFDQETVGLHPEVVRLAAGQCSRPGEEHPVDTQTSQLLSVPITAFGGKSLEIAVHQLPEC